MNTIQTIIPIFVVIFLGTLARKKGWIPNSFLKPANQLTFYLAIPAMIFRAIVKSDFRTQFDSYLLISTLLPLFVIFILFWLFTIITGVPKSQRGTLVESSVHGNIGYIGLAVVFYFLGAEALPSTGILLAFLMLAHNGLAVVVLQINATSTSKKKGWIQILSNIVVNPIILTATAGIGCSLIQFQMPVIIDRTLGILANLALPLALLLIGASLSFHVKIKQLVMVVLASLAKLIVLPALGLWLYIYFNLEPSAFLPGLILLSAPVATVSYIIAVEMNGDPDLAVTTISISTALSSVTMVFWLYYVETIL